MIEIVAPHTWATFNTKGYNRVIQFFRDEGYRITDHSYAGGQTLHITLTPEDEMAYRLKYGDGTPPLWWLHDD